MAHALGVAIRHYFFLAAFGMTALALWLGRRRVAVLRSGGTERGTVIEHARREVDESVSFHPTVVFTDDTGTTRRFTSNAGWSTPRPAVGTRVKVVYSRTDPNVAYIASFLHLWAAPVALLLMSVVALAAGLTMRE